MIFYLLNKGQQTVKILNNNETVESNLDEAINEADELKFSVPLQKRLDSNIYYVLIPTDSGNDFFMFKIISEDIQKDRVEYSAVESAYDELKSYSYIKDIRPNQMNAAQMLQQVLKNTRWSLGYVEDTGIQSATFYYITILEAIQKIVDLFKVELTFTIQLDPVTQQITGRKVNLYQQQGRRTGKRFEYGSNLLTVTREENSQNLVTALVGRGKGIQVSGQDTEDKTDDGYGRRLTFADVEWKTAAGAPVNKPKGQEYVEDPKATALYGFSDGSPRIGLVVFEDIEDPNQLLNATWSALLEAKRPKVSFKAEVTDVGDLQLGDTIAIIRHDLGIEYFTRVYKVHHDLKDKNKNTVEMGDDFSSRSITSAISTAIQISQDATKVANDAATSANGKNRNFYSNTKPNLANEGDNLYLNLGNGETELWVWHHGQWEFVQSTVELHTVKKEVQETQSGLNDAKKQIADNLAKADKDIAELNESINNQKGSLDGLSTTVNTVVIPKVTDVTNQASDAIKKVNEQKNIVTGLQNQAIQQGKDISKITSDVHGVTVDLANLNGDVNQTKATVQGLQSTLGNAQGDIAQIKVDAKKLETSLSGKVDNSTYATFVSQTNQALSAKLVASDLNGYAKTTDVQATANGLQVNINNISDRMNNLRIGADNMLKGTDNFANYQANNYAEVEDIAKSNYISLISNHPELTHMAHLWKEQQSIYSNQEIILEKDKSYWFGFYICTDRTNGSPFENINVLGVESGNDLSDSKVFIEQNSKNYSYFGGAPERWIWHTYKIIGDGNVYSGIRVEGSKSTGGSAYLAGYTLIQSDVAPTGHMESLNDTKHELVQLSTQIEANDQKFSSYYTKIETDNKTNVAKNEAINTIKNDSNWHGLNNILTNSGFLQTSDGFTQKVQQVTQPIINSVNSGGVNLLGNTYNFGGFTSEQKGKWDFDPKSSYSNNAGYALIKTMIAHIYGNSWNNSKLNFNQTIYLPAGKYIFSFLASVNSNQTNSFNLKLTADVNGVNKVLQGDSGKITYSWKVHTMEFTLLENSVISNLQLYNSSNDALPGGSIYFANLKLESGSIATTWCPAPEDYATQISFSELTQTVRGLQSTVSNNFTNLQSQLSQTAGTIRTEVTNKTNNLQSQITQNANNFNIKLQNSASGGGVNLLANTLDFRGFYSSSVDVNGKNGISLDEKDGYYQDKNYSYIRTKISHVWGSNFKNAPLCFNQKIYLPAGTYTLSFLARTNGNNSNNANRISLFTSYTDAHGGQQLGESDYVHDWWEKHHITFSITENYLHSNIRLQKWDSAALPGGSIYFANLKLESGSIATTWCPAPEDQVSKNKILAQINVAAGTTLIQNDKIYMDASSTVFSGKAFIPDAAITNVSADKINTGTLDAGRINVINLNANNITTGTIKGQNSSFNLTDGTLTALNQYNEGVFMRNGKLEFTSRQSWNNNSTATYGYIQSLPKMFALGYNYGGLDINGTSGFVLHNDKTKIKTSNSGQSGSAVEGGSYIFGSDGLTSINNENSVIINAGAQSYSEWTAGISLLSGNASRNVPPSITLGSSNSLNDRSTVTISGSLAVLGSKNAAVRTSQGLTAINAYETAEYYFGDIGRAKTNSNETVCIYMDPLFLETVNTGIPYHIFLTSYSEARIWVSEMYPSYFVIRSDKPNADFVWEIKAKRKGYENDRLKIIDQEKKVNE